MLYAISQELREALARKNVPIPVVFGPEDAESLTSSRERIVFEHSLNDKKDQTQPAKAVHHNPPMPLIRLQAAKIRIFATSPLAGAQWHDHAERAEQVLDHVQAELDAIVRGRRNAITWGAGGFVALQDENGTDLYAGAVYEQDIAIDRGVFRVTWQGAGADEVVIGKDVSLSTIVKASAETGPAGTPPATAETVSGG